MDSFHPHSNPKMSPIDQMRNLSPQVLRDVSKITDSEFEPMLAGSKATGTVWGKSKGGGEGGGGDWGGLGDPAFSP